MAEKKEEEFEIVRCPSAYIRSDLHRTGDPCFDGQGYTTFAENAQRLLDQTYVVKAPGITRPAITAADVSSSVNEAAAEAADIGIGLHTEDTATAISNIEIFRETDTSTLVTEAGSTEKVTVTTKVTEVIEEGGATVKITTTVETREPTDEIEKSF